MSNGYYLLVEVIIDICRTNEQIKTTLKFEGFSYETVADTWKGTEVVGDITYYYTVMLEEDGKGSISITTAASESIIDLQITSYTFDGENIVVNYKNYAGASQVVNGQMTLSVSEGELGSLIYADFYMPTSIFTDKGLNALIDFKTHDQNLELVYLFGEYRETIRNYVENKMLNESDYPERQGCIPVSEELATILQQVMDTAVLTHNSATLTVVRSANMLLLLLATLPVQSTITR